MVIDINGYYAAQSGITLAQGTAGAPSLSFGGDAGTGIFSSGAQTLDFATGGTDRLTLRSDGDVDIPGSMRKNGSLFLHNLGTQSMGVGLGAMAVNTGIQNTAIGFQALQANTTGNSNTAAGGSALFSNTTGFDNTANGVAALFNNTTGSDNTASGGFVLVNNTTGTNNTAIGDAALRNNTTGSYNTAIGFSAGFNLTTGSNTIMIGNAGVAGDDHAIKIGDVQTNTFIAGINGVAIAGGVGVLIDSSGHLGTMLSSRRYKEDIQDMGDASSKLLRLRPVTFRYKRPYADGSEARDYGLIAEEVAEVYPDLVVKGKDGQVETVQYHKLTPMLLNEVQKQHRHAQQQDETIQKQQREIEALKAKLAGMPALEARLAALEALMSSKVAATATAGQ